MIRSGDPMELFSILSVVFSIILGLGIANLLTSLVAMFRSRGHGRLHWMPLVWAGCIFVFQIQFWWAIIELRNMVQVWTVTEFLLLLTVALLLFLAAALVIPEKELDENQNLLDVFHQDGQWSLAILSCYAFVAGIVDHVFWGIPFVSLEMGYLAAEIVLPLLNILTRKVWLESLTTISYVLVCVASNIYLSPGSYM